MIKFREILEDNGVEITIWDSTYTLCSNVKINNWSITLVSNTYTEEYVIEQACRQYIKENGFKLEWLQKHIKIVYDIEIHKTNNYYKFYNLRDAEWMYHRMAKSLNVLMAYTHDKLLSYINAEDIKIIEE